MYLECQSYLEKILLEGGERILPHCQTIRTSLLLITAAEKSLNKLPVVPFVLTSPVGDVGLVRLPSPLPSGEPSPGSIAGIVVGIVVGDRLEFSRLSSPPKEEELASRFGPPVPFLMLLSFRLFKSSPIPPSTGVLAPSDELTAAGGVLAGISRLPSRSSRS
uniref:Uncharacterized protein n=1 Tax=Anopheles melas TaxID=34690 RepID=A0A182U5C4_9DIPT